MWICKKCHQVCEELSALTEFHPWGDTFAKELLNRVNCNCGGEFVLAHKCKDCGEWFCEDDLTNGLCTDCIYDELTVENCLQYIKDNKYERDFFVDWWTGMGDYYYTSDNFLNMCVKGWENKNSSELESDREKAKQSIISFAKDDIYDFSDWLKGRSK